MKWTKFLWLLVMAAVLAGFGYLYYHKIAQLEALRRQQFEYERRVLELEEKAATLAREIELMESDHGLEKMGREKLGLVRPNEKVFIFDPTPPPPKK